VPCSPQLSAHRAHLPNETLHLTPSTPTSLPHRDLVCLWEAPAGFCSHRTGIGLPWGDRSCLQCLHRQSKVTLGWDSAPLHPSLSLLPLPSGTKGMWLGAKFVRHLCQEAWKKPEVSSQVKVKLTPAAQGSAEDGTSPIQPAPSLPSQQLREQTQPPTRPSWDTCLTGTC
jgi:hypothetical protein